ncbi:hypothetical protein LZL87_007808 [Fusarium oxysporum]|nr:hypothetical protein LZL87_007808 [Fusarium oxysporum]
MPSKDPELFYESSPDTRMPGVQCPKCTTAEEEVWVIPGHSCPYCGMVLNVSKNSTVSTFNMGREMTAYAAVVLFPLSANIRTMGS